MRAGSADPACLPNPVFSPKSIVMGKYRLFFEKKGDFMRKKVIFRQNGVFH
jgi:hypothetical protein